MKILIDGLDKTGQNKMIYNTKISIILNDNIRITKKYKKKQ